MQNNADKSFHTFFVIPHELFDGSLKHPSSDHSPARVEQELAWVSVDPFTDEVAEEAANIQNKLRQAGKILSKAEI